MLVGVYNFRQSQRTGTVIYNDERGNQYEVTEAKEVSSILEASTFFAQYRERWKQIDPNCVSFVYYPLKKYVKEGKSNPNQEQWDYEYLTGNRFGYY